ncbi:flagellar hook-length control protein FliK [Vreelandella venusta]|uniref:flagellar hook-length control protein FliK n=1 Tax=Vreelandella venusta TaxID=44935 RepID=UPI0018DAC8CB|nr:flagellar hook-length control protein FliK [Halomonas venusta]QPI64247.1 flagellar hook-length control protein FliK [Halomonas venusta]
MTIELLLTMQGQGANSSSSSSAAPGSPRAAQGMFLQAFTQAASQQARPFTSAQAESAPKLSLSDIVEQLASLDGELDEETLSSIVATVSAQGQATDMLSSGTDSVALAQTLETASAAREPAWAPEQASSSPAEGTETVETTTQMTIAEVASRLALIASYSTPSTANPAGSGAHPATPSAASLSQATVQTPPGNLAPSNASPATVALLASTALASAAPPDGQVALAGERAVAETPRIATQTPANAAASTMALLPTNGSATAPPNNTGELAQSAAGPSLTSALAATAQQAIGATNASRPTASSAKALPVEAATTPVNTPTLAASLETIPAQPFTTMQPGMHALSPLNTALTPTVNADAVASLFAEAETVSVTSSASKGSEQVLPAALTSQNQAMPNSPATATLNTPLTSPAWPSQLGQQLIQFAQRGGEHQVKMQLHPAELGPLSITLKVTEQGTQAHFLSSHAPVRQALEQAIPQLREALAEQGISLGETSVGEQQTPNEQAFAQQTPGKSAGNRGGESGSDSAPSLTEVDDQSSQDGRVDLYA